jgi:hypothetical protein
MKVNQWTLGLAAAGVISFGAVAQAEEKPSHQVLTAVSSTTLSGYVSTSAIWKPGTSAGGGTGPAVLNGANANAVNKVDGFNLDVVNLAVSKPLDEGEWAAGYTAELLLGPDAGPGNAFATGGGAHLAIKQAYVALNAPVGNGITLKLGVWDTPIGYEAYNYTANPNYSRSIGYGLEPTTYTGLLASYKVCEGFSVTAGVANSAAGAVAINGKSATESDKAYLGAITVTAPDSLGFLKGSTLTAGVINHAGTGAIGGAAKIVNYYVGATLNTPVDALKLGVAWDYQGNSRSGANFGGYANATSIYTSYALTEKIKLNTRAEYASGTSGVAAGSGTAIFAPLANAGKVPGGNNSQFVSLTGTVDYALWANVISRLEARLDSDVSGSPNNVFGGAAADEKNNFTVALNIIYKF